MFFHLDGQLPSFQKLLDTDQKCLLSFKKLLSAIVQHGGIGKTRKEALHNIGVAGSTFEGALLARMFKEVKNKVNKEVELDLEFTVIEIPSTHKYIVEDVANKKGFVKMSIKKNLLPYINGINWQVDGKDFHDYFDEITKNGYLMPYYFKQKVLEKVEYRNGDREIEFIIAAALNTKPDAIKITQPVQEVTKAAVGNYLDLFIQDRPIMKISWDVVIVFRIKWWPDVAKEWILRERNWPNLNIIKELTEVSYIIPKPSDELKFDKDTMELRYSFGHLERELISRRSSEQRYIYLVFKSMFYKWIKPLDDDRIQSYVAKTTMLWVCERYPPDNSIWQSKSTTTTLTLLFRELLSAFQKGNLPYYFIPSINVIQMIEDSLKKKVVLRIQEIVDDLQSFIPTNVGKVIKVSHEILDIVESVNGVMDDLRNGNYLRFLKNPDLASKAIALFGDQLEENGLPIKNLNKEVEKVKSLLDKFEL